MTKHDSPIKERSEVSRWRKSAVALAVCAMSIVTFEAQALSSIERRGKALAARFCAECHAIGTKGASPQVGAPPFRNISDRVDLDTLRQRLRAGLSSGHPAMPTFRFSREDSLAFLAYVRMIQRR